MHKKYISDCNCMDFEPNYNLNLPFDIFYKCIPINTQYKVIRIEFKSLELNLSVP